MHGVTATASMLPVHCTVQALISSALYISLRHFTAQLYSAQCTAPCAAVEAVRCSLFPKTVSRQAATSLQHSSAL